MSKFMSKKDSGGKEIIMEVGLAVIGVALLIVFRYEIANLVNSLMESATEKIEDLFNTNITGTIG